MMTLLAVCFTVSFIVNIVGLVLFRMAAKRLIDFDNMCEYITDDMEIFSDYLNGLVAKSTFSRSPDVMALTQNMRVMKERYDSYIESFGKLTKKERVVKQITKPPVVVD